MDASSWRDLRAAGLWALLLLWAAALALLPLSLAALLVLGAGFGLALLRWPVTGLYALALAIPLGPVLRLPLGTAAIGITDSLVAATAAAWFMRRVAGRERLKPALLLWLILPFLAVLILSTLAAQSLEQALPELIKWSEVAVVYFLASQLLEGRARQGLVLALITAASGEALIGLRQFLFRIGPEAFQLGAFLRAYGTFNQPNPFAGYLGLILPLGLALSLWALQAARKHPRSLPAWLLAACLLGLTALIGGGLLASWSRGGWMGALLAVLAVFALTSIAGRVLLLLGGLGAAIAYPLLPASIGDRLAGVTAFFGVWDVRGIPVTDANFAILERVAHWQAAWAMLADHPWLGVGVGNWDVAYPAYAVGQWLDPLGHAHNVLFHYAAVAGLPGALGYLWFWLGGLAAALLAVHRRAGFERALAVGVSGLFIHLSVHNQFDNLFVQGMPLVVALALGLLTYEPSRQP